MALSRAITAPVVFLSHGAGPAAFLDFKGSLFHPLDKSSKTAAFTRGLDPIVKASNGGEAVQSVLVVSAHWEESEFTIDSSDKSKLLYDYYGFPEEAYAPALTYPLQPDVHLAQRAHQLLTSNGIKSVFRPREEGFDHGTFIPMKLAYPQADIPVAQLSLKSSLDIEEHIALGEALAPLRKEGVMVLASGQISHNLQAIREGNAGGTDRAIEFIEWIRDLLEGTTEHNYEERKQMFIDIPHKAPHFAWQHPRTEHFLPLAVAFGASKPQGTVGERGTYAARRVFHDLVLGSFATDCYVFSASAHAWG
jgi:aromatic ring-opening dioxygenase catalytic subunit (LigB family)